MGYQRPNCQASWPSTSACGPWPPTWPWVSGGWGFPVGEMVGVCWKSIDESILIHLTFLMMNFCICIDFSEAIHFWWFAFHFPFHGIRKDLKLSRKACNLQCLPAEKRELRAVKWGEIRIHPPCIGESFKVASVESWHMVTVSSSKVSQMNVFFFANQGMGSKYTVMSYEKYVRRGAEFFDVVKQTFHGLGVANFWVKVINFCQPYFLTTKAFLSKALNPQSHTLPTVRLTSARPPQLVWLSFLVLQQWYGTSAYGFSKNRRFQWFSDATIVGSGRTPNTTGVYKAPTKRPATASTGASKKPKVMKAIFWWRKSWLKGLTTFLGKLGDDPMILI